MRGADIQRDKLVHEEKIKVQINTQLQTTEHGRSQVRMTMHIKNTQVDSCVYKMKTGNNDILIELAQKQEKIQIYHNYKNILVKLYMLNKVEEKSRGNKS